MGNTTAPPSNSTLNNSNPGSSKINNNNKHIKFFSEIGSKSNIISKKEKKIGILKKSLFCLHCKNFFMNMVEHKDHKEGVITIDDYLLKHFDFISLLGSGTYGRVFKVKDLTDDLPKALKYIPLTKGKKEEIDLDIVKILYHDNIIRYFQSEKIEKKKYCYILMELADMDLSELIRRELLSTNYMKYELVYQIATAIDYLHNDNSQEKPSIIHRDLKPQNILIVNNKAKITDFGTSKIKASRNPLLNSTVRGVAGTDFYIPPELQRSMNDEFVICNDKHDIWSFGIIVHQIFAKNKLPFDTLNNGDWKIKRMLGQYTMDPTIMKNSLAHEIIAGCLEEDINKRKNIKEILGILSIIKNNKISIHSTIITSVQNLNFIERLFDGWKIIKCKLLFKASENFFSAKLFHDFCDQMGPTIIFIKSKKGMRFGGYNPVSWQSFNSKKYIPSNGSFLFSIDKEIKLPLISPDSESAILCYSDTGPGFGHNLVISDFCDKNISSFCSLGYEYGLRTFLDDTENFSVEEYEVFSVELA